MRLRRMARGLAVALAVVVATVALAGFGGALWLRSNSGRAWIDRQLTGFVDGKINGKLTIGRIEGPLWGFVILDDVRLVDPNGQFVGHARKVAIDLDPWTALRKRTHIRRLYVLEPELDLEPLTDGRLHLEVLANFLRQRQRRLRIDGLAMLQTTLNVRPLKGPLTRVERTRLVLRLFTVDHARSGEIDLVEANGRLELAQGPSHAFALESRLRWDPQTRLAADRLRFHAGDTFVDARVAVRPAIDRFDLDLVKLHLSARDFHQLVPLENAPADIDGHASVHGTLEHLAVELELHPGDGTVHLRGHANWPAKLLTAVVDHHELRGAFFPTRPKFVLDEARVRLHVKYDGKGLVGPVALENASGTVDDKVSFQKGAATAVFFPDGVDFARIALETRYGAVSGDAHITFKGLIRLNAQVARPHVTLELKVDKQPHQKAHIHLNGVELGHPEASNQPHRPL